MCFKKCNHSNRLTLGCSFISPESPYALRGSALEGGGPGRPGPAPGPRPLSPAPPLFPAARGPRDHPGLRVSPLGAEAAVYSRGARGTSAGAAGLRRGPAPRLLPCGTPLPFLPGLFLLALRVSATYPPGSLPWGPGLRQRLRS